MSVNGLWRHVGWSTNQRRLLGAHPGGDIQVQKLPATSREAHDVLWLDVTVHKALLVEALEGLQYLRSWSGCCYTLHMLLVEALEGLQYLRLVCYGQGVVTLCTNERGFFHLGDPRLQTQQT
jgi:hypothetical protein